MIHEEICAYELCKLAKEKGFPQDYQSWTGDLYDKNGELCFSTDSEFCVAPTQSLLQRWLREEKSIDIEIYPIFINGVRVYTGCIYASNLNKPKKFNYLDTYELALENALKYALENLI